MFGILARNVISAQGRYTADSINDMRDAALKSENLAEPWYTYLREKRAFCEALAELRKEDKYLTWDEILKKYEPYLSENHPKCYEKALEDRKLNIK